MAVPRLLLWVYLCSRVMECHYASTDPVFTLEPSPPPAVVQVNVNWIVPGERRTALHAAVIHSQAGCVKVLLNYGADPGIRDKHGKSAIDLATETGQRPLEEDPIYRLVVTKVGARGGMGAVCGAATPPCRDSHPPVTAIGGERGVPRWCAGACARRLVRARQHPPTKLRDQRGGLGACRRRRVPFTGSRRMRPYVLSGSVADSPRDGSRGAQPECARGIGGWFYLNPKWAFKFKSVHLPHSSQATSHYPPALPLALGAKYGRSG